METYYRSILIMDNKEFKKQVGLVAKANGFKTAFGAWYKESDECVVVVKLQKSNYGNYYYLNIDGFIQGAFGRRHVVNRYLIKVLYYGEVSTQISNNPIFDLSEEEPMGDEERISRLNDIFSDYVVPFVDLALSRAGVIQLFREGRVYLTPVTREELGMSE